MWYLKVTNTYLCKGIVGLEGPDPLGVRVVGGDASLLAQRPQPDRAVTAPAQALRPVPV